MSIQIQILNQTEIPSLSPSMTPTTNRPSKSPTNKPTRYPTTHKPSLSPSMKPTESPLTQGPSLTPSMSPSTSPTNKTNLPTPKPLLFPSNSPTTISSTSPTMTPSVLSNDIESSNFGAGAIVGAGLVLILIGMFCISKIYRCRKNIPVNNPKLKERLLTVETITINESQNNSNYKNWNTNDIVSWIIQLDNGKYKAYANGLKKNMDIDGVNGSNLDILSSNDLSLYGIRNMEHRNEILNHIKTLIASDVEGMLDENNENYSIGTERF